VNASTLVQKLWNHCNVLRDDGMRYGGYVERLFQPGNGAPVPRGSRGILKFRMTGPYPFVWTGATIHLAGLQLY